MRISISGVFEYYAEDEGIRESCERILEGMRGEIA